MYAIYVTALAVALQVVATYFAWAIYKFHRMGTGWLAVIAAVILMAIRLILNFFLQTGVVPYTPFYLDLHDTWLQLLISTFMLIGLYSMYKSFESFDIVGKKVAEKATRFAFPPCKKPGKKR